MSRSGTPTQMGEPGKKAGVDYEVGYKRPPISSRFRHGGVGNPKGRPKKKKTVGQTIEEALMTRVTVEENGRSKSITAQEVIIRNLVHAAARRDGGAIRLLFALKERYQASTETTLNPSELENEDRKILQEYLAMLKPFDTDVSLAPSADQTSQKTNDSNATENNPTCKPPDSDGDVS
jgi:hypothetical protein